MLSQASRGSCELKQEILSTPGALLTISHQMAGKRNWIYSREHNSRQLVAITTQWNQFCSACFYLPPRCRGMGHPETVTLSCRKVAVPHMGLDTEIQVHHQTQGRLLLFTQTVSAGPCTLSSRSLEQGCASQCVGSELAQCSPTKKFQRINLMD